jgi:hypothetical protein
MCLKADLDAIEPSYEKSVKTVYIDIVSYAL